MGIILQGLMKSVVYCGRRGLGLNLSVDENTSFSGDRRGEKNLVGRVFAISKYCGIVAAAWAEPRAHHIIIESDEERE